VDSATSSSQESIMEMASSESDSSVFRDQEHRPCRPTSDTHHEENFINFMKNPTKAATLCPCTDSTISDIVFLVLSLGVRHSLTWDAQVDILKMLSTIFKGKDGIPTSKYLYFKYLGVKELPITFEIFCSFCESYLGEKDKIKDIKKCTFCDADININSPANSFVSLSIGSQLETFF